MLFIEFPIRYVVHTYTPKDAKDARWVKVVPLRGRFVGGVAVAERYQL